MKTLPKTGGFLCLFWNLGGEPKLPRQVKWDENQGPEARKSTPEAPKATREAPKATPEVPKATPGALGRFSGAVLGDFGLQKSSPEGPRSNEKRTKKRLENRTFLGIVFGSVFDDFGGPKRRQNHPESLQKEVRERKQRFFDNRAPV